MTREVSNPSPDESRGLGQDLVGIAIFAAAVFLIVSVSMAMRGQAQEPSGVQAFFHSLVARFGPLPCLALGVAMAGIGGKLWLFGLRRHLLRHVFGVVACSLCLAILAGAFSDTAGGSLGDALGGAVRRTTHWSLAALVGMLALALPAWVAWLKPAVFGVAAEGNRGPSATRNEPLTDSEGITAAEAEALLPPVPSPVRMPTLRKAWVDQVQAPSPYPPDPRRVGGIPAGTTPLAARHAPSTPQPPANDPAPVGRSAAQGLDRAGHGAAAHLASAESGTDPFAAVVFDGPSARAADAAPAGRKQPAQELAPRVEQRPLAQPSVAEPAPRASWEDDSVEVEDSPALHVDAYGTPRELVAQLRSANETARADLDGYEGEDDELGEPKPLDPETAQAVLERLRAAKQDPAGSPATAQAQVPSTLEEDIEFEGISVDAEDEDDAQDDGEVVDAEDLEDAETEEVWNEDESGAEESDEDDEAPEEIAQAPTRVASDELRPRAPGARAKSRPQPSLFESELEPQQAKAGHRPASKPAQAPTTPQRQATATAASAGSGSALPASSSATPIDDLVFRAGCLFLERQRVAVSMLQKDFGMDFKRATSVLDQLQDAGLIGPYLGGQRRDILMNLDQWKARAAVEVSPAN